MCVCVCVSVGGWVGEWVSERVSEWVGEFVSEYIFLCTWYIQEQNSESCGCCFTAKTKRGMLVLALKQ